jgi:FAD/FMN-containing dehydrogenase
MIDIEKLKQNFKGEILNDVESRARFSRDASIFEATPEIVAQPASVEDVQGLVRFASQEKQSGHDVSLTARAGGTDMTGGSISESIVIDFTKHLNQIGHIQPSSPDGARITVQPGAYYRDLESATLAQGLVMPSYPASKAICGVGGMVGNNAGGEKSLSYGQTVDWVKELEVVLADGNTYTVKPLTEAELANKIKEPTFEGQLYKQIWNLISLNYETIRQAEPSTSKNSAGYYLWKVWDGKIFDLTKLLVGSQGTLGLITNITFKLAQVQQHSRTVVMFMQDLHELGHVITEIKKLRPESFELYDDHTLKLAVQYMPEMVKKMGGGLKLFWQFMPELWMSITGGFPRLVLLAEFTADTDVGALEKATIAQTEMRNRFKLHSRITKDAMDAKKYWTIRRESYNLLRQHTQNRMAACFIEDIIVHPDQLPEFLPRLNEIFSRYPSFVYTIAGHAGDANFHIMPLMDLNEQSQRDAVIRLSNEVFHLVMEYKGSITAEHNDGIVRGPYLEMMFGPKIMELFRQTKKIFDPLNIFNPHKKTDADMDYYQKHLRHK